jgi:hypothetical protein
MEVPPDVPRPFKVGQPVVARHPGTRQLHDGIILTIKSNKYRVQFTRSELMTEMVGGGRGPRRRRWPGAGSAGSCPGARLPLAPAAGGWLASL